MRNILLFLVACLFSLPLYAQGTWSGECTAAQPCMVLADPPPPVAGVTYTTCTLSGAPVTPAARPLVAKATLPDKAKNDPAVKDPTCFWGGIVLAPGTYNLAASIQDAGGRSSPLSTPPFVVIALPPLGSPTGLRVLPQ